MWYQSGPGLDFPGMFSPKDKYTQNIAGLDPWLVYQTWGKRGEASRTGREILVSDAEPELKNKLNRKHVDLSQYS